MKYSILLSIAAGVLVTVLPVYSQMPPTSGQLTQAWMMPGGMGSMMAGPVVGPDGTVYLVKTNVAVGRGGMMGGTATNVKTQLVAVLAGSVSWTLDLDGWMISRLVLSPDGNIIMSESFPPDFVFGLAGSQANVQDRNAKLLIVTPMGNSAQILAQTPVDTDALSEPSIVTLPDGSYQILATGFDMGGMMDALFNGRANSQQRISLCTFDSKGNLLSEITP
jgi:hypothetical protein